MINSSSSYIKNTSPRGVSVFCVVGTFVGCGVINPERAVHAPEEARCKTARFPRPLPAASLWSSVARVSRTGSSFARLRATQPRDSTTDYSSPSSDSLLCVALRRSASLCVALRRSASLCVALRRFASHCFATLRERGRRRPAQALSAGCPFTLRRVVLRRHRHRHRHRRFLFLVARVRARSREVTRGHA